MTAPIKKESAMTAIVSFAGSVVEITEKTLISAAPNARIKNNKKRRTTGRRAEHIKLRKP